MTEEDASDRDGEHEAGDRSVGDLRARGDGEEPATLAWELLGKHPGSCGWVKVVTATFRMPNGSTAEWDLVEGPDIVAILAVTTEGEVVSVRQFRPGPARVLRDLPGGIVDPGEAPLEAAVRELREETGYAGTPELVGHLWSGASHVRRQWVVAITGCERVGEPEPGEMEFLEVETVPLAKLRKHLLTGELTDAGAAYRALDHLGLL